ncbi:MAG: hypothetical protein IPI45_10990 [Saprospiraceae bacterium]|nr:hypothetical protein [Saprospiraceae bacterium]MBK7738286.1 hypothetical protein [Saprospiraceae bacterium]MBK7913141.1 hypothetical protein [Saprospiraceae bacterium]
MKSNFYYFIMLISITISYSACKEQSISSTKDKENSQIDSVLKAKAEVYDLLFSRVEDSSKFMNDLTPKVAKAIVRSNIETNDGSGAINLDKERSVFFKISDLLQVVNGYSKDDLLKMGVRVYLGRYGRKQIIEDYLGSKQFELYKNRRTVIIQLMDKDNNVLISKDGKWVNANLGELCPPCSDSNSPTGGDKDPYIQE